MNRPTKIAVAVAAVAMTLVYGWAVNASYAGAGYPTASERSYRTGGSTYFFWGSSRMYSRPSTRGGSRGGTGTRGGGFRGGK